MSDELDIQPVGDLVDDPSDPELGRARFQENRRYDRRPAIENLDRPAMLISSRTDHPPPRVWNAALVTAGLVIVLLLLAVGVLIGLLMGRPSSESVEAASFADGSDPSNAVGSSVPTNVAPTDGSTGVAAAETAALDTALAALDLTRISFVPGTAELTPAGRTAISELAVVLLEAPAEPVEILVRTFSESTPGSNHGLSTHQADTILSELSRAGVNPQRVTATGLGSSGSERPSVAAAIRFEATDQELAGIILDHGPVTVEPAFDGIFSSPTASHLSSLGQYLAQHPEVELSLVGYAWSAGTSEANHEASHHLLDDAKALLVANGAAPGQIDLVGLGEVNIPLANRVSEVTVETGSAAVLGVALANVELDAIAFEQGTATLAASGQTALEGVIGILIVDPTIRVEVAVHSYSEATSQANHDLSQRQGDAIISYLTNAGISPSQLLLEWHGDPPHFAAPGRLNAVTFTVIR